MGAHAKIGAREVRWVWWLLAPACAVGAPCTTPPVSLPRLPLWRGFNRWPPPGCCCCSLKRAAAAARSCVLLLRLAHACCCRCCSSSSLKHAAAAVPRQALPTGATPNKPAKWKPFRSILENDNNGCVPAAGPRSAGMPPASVLIMLATRLDITLFFSPDPQLHALSWAAATHLTVAALAPAALPRYDVRP